MSSSAIRPRTSWWSGISAEFVSCQASEKVRLNIAGGVQDPHHFDAGFADGTVKDDVILEIGAAEAGREFGARMACAVMKGEMLDSLLDFSNPAVGLKFAVPGDVGPNLFEISQALEGTANDRLHAA